MNQHGEQKGVDSLIVTDLINLARNRAMADALLLTGDEDIRVGVQQAQEFGVRVHLIGIAPARDNQSGFLVQEADTIRELPLAGVQAFLKRVPTTAPAAASSSSPAPVVPTMPQPASAILAAAAQRIAAELNPEEMAAVLKESVGGSVPAQIDRRLLVAGTQATGGAQLTSDQKRRIRRAFLDACGNPVKK